MYPLLIRCEARAAKLIVLNNCVFWTECTQRVKSVCMTQNKTCFIMQEKMVNQMNQKQKYMFVKCHRIF